MEYCKQALFAAFTLAVISVETTAVDTPLHVKWLTGHQAPTSALVSQSIEDAMNLAAQTGDHHFVIQLGEPDGRHLRESLEKSGVNLLSYLGNQTYFATVHKPKMAIDPWLRESPTVRAFSIQRSWKLHPYLNAGNKPEWAIVEGGTRADPRVGIYVLFHGDVDLTQEAAKTVQRMGGTIRASLISVNGLVIEISYSKILALVDRDIVQFVEPALPRFTELNDGNRLLVGADTVQAAPFNLDGTGVTAMIYDVGSVKRSTDNALHPDLTGRVILADTSPAAPHAAHVACTLGGSGSTSPGGNLGLRGMAPGVTMLSYGIEHDGSLIPLYSNPGDMETDYNNAINVRNADIANNSIGTNACANALFIPCSIAGDYGTTSALIDNMVRGSLGTPFRVIWANGNERACTNCPDEHVGGYHSTAPPACNKNAISVGAVNSDDDSMTTFSSWGPCDDGRIKPDITAPGCQSTGDFTVTSCNTSFGTFGYSGRCGTSMAAPTVTGLAALILQDFRVQFPATPDPRNSTIKVLLAHNAVDTGNEGPDYQSGYGSVRIEPTINFMRSGQFFEADLGNGQTQTIFVTVDAGDPELKVTLAWDDIAGTPNVIPSLINDLDLRVFDPLGVQHFPWTLDPAIPSSPAVRTQADHLNNIEQVVVNAPAAGVWRIEVFGFNVIADTIIATGLQPYSLATSVAQIACTSQGTIAFDLATYACEDTATIQIVDCDLNTNNLVIDTVNINVQSTSEPGGEIITLTETSASSAIFSGSIPLSVTDAVGTLLTANADTITATYVDAEDGLGGLDVIVTANATATCSSASINVTVRLEGIDTPVTRNVTLVITDCVAGLSETTTLPVAFNNTGKGTVSLVTSLTNATWLSVNEEHTLRRLQALSNPLPVNISFSGAKELLAGDFSGDGLVDVVDFSILATRWGLAGSQADINGDNLQSTADFTALGINLLKFDEAIDGCSP